jgi:putative ABC transport system permease protein
MNRLKIIGKSLLFYIRANLLIALGITVSTAVLTGALIIGDSVSYSLTQIATLRLGNTTHALRVVDRYFRQDLAGDMSRSGSLDVVPVLLSEGVAISEGGAHRANRVQVVGIDTTFHEVAGSHIYSGLGRNEIIVSSNLANRLSVVRGDDVVLRIKKATQIPLNAPFMSDEETSVSFRARIKDIASDKDLGRFSLQNSQTAPFNAFMAIERLNELMEFSGKANTLLIHSSLDPEELTGIVRDSWKPEDAGLIFRNITKTGENEILSERVFMDPSVYDCFGSLPGANGVFTYFVNSIAKRDGPNRVKETPYSFVSTRPVVELAKHQLIINQWLADDLGARVGDTLHLAYYVAGPLRKLIQEEASFVVSKVVGMKSIYADSTLMPYIPGLYDAGSCSEWEAGIPIDLDKIRDKDEAYWDQYQGMPKAYISIERAREIWANRFGNYTSVRFSRNQFDAEDFRERFQKALDPADLGFVILPVKENGLEAAQNGVSFSQLFMGLSFFLLVSALLLSALLFLLHLENRKEQIGTLTVLGFQPNQVRNLFLWEGFLLSVFGALAGIVLGVGYTRIVFQALNSLWNDIVRTNILTIQLVPLTLVKGFLISTMLSLAVIRYSLHRIQKQQAAVLQKKIAGKEKSGVAVLKMIVASLTGMLSIFILIEQFMLEESQNPSYFFISGTLMLVSLILFADRLLVTREGHSDSGLTLRKLSIRNLSRNRNRSLTVFLLLALGTFLVLSTGSNRKDLFRGADRKTSGTGGFLFYAETTMPVLSDLNDPDYRVKEGLSDTWKVVQLRRMEGDDASCLNLNLISRPAILGVDPEKLQGRFSFSATDDMLDEAQPWLSLNKKAAQGVIPAIADQTVIRWGLGKKVGDTLFYTNEAGDTLALKLIGGLAPSVFQGNVIISNTHFLENYPSHSGSQVFLIESSPENKQNVANELILNFRDYGWEQSESAQRLAAFYSVTNTYLAIFLALGAMGMMLGTLGLAIVLARTILERKQEIALLRAVGFSKRKIFNLLVSEYSALLAGGVLIGFITAVIAALPSFLSDNTEVSLINLAGIVGIILLNGAFWIAMLTWFFVQRKNLVVALKNE